MHYYNKSLTFIVCAMSAWQFQRRNAVYFGRTAAEKIMRVSRKSMILGAHLIKAPLITGSLN